MRALRTLALLASGAWLLVSGQADDVCRAQDHTYSTETLPDGSHQPPEKMNPISGAITSRFFVTLVNLTPHRIKLDNTHTYQMDIFEFGDVPPGRARQNRVKYRGTWHTGDDAGEAYYSLEGTDKRFAVRLRSHQPDRSPRSVVMDLSHMGLGQREYSFPGAETAVTLVITGSDAAGFHASLRHGPGNWMRSIYDVIRDRPLRHLIMPGTHDSGMSDITGQIISIGAETNTQNQGVNIYDQLRAGARWFDLRVGSVHDNDDAGQVEGFWTMHLSDEMAPLAVGNTGEPLDDVIAEVNRFTAESPGEIIFISMRYLVGRFKFPDRGPIVWGHGLVDAFFAKLRAINNRCLDLDTRGGLQNHKASYFMDRNDGKGCVILLLSGQLQGDVPRESPADGIYDGSALSVRDHWSDMEHPRDMAPDQIAAWREYARGGSDDPGHLHIAQWLVTPHAVASTILSLQNYAIQPTNPSLYWAGVNGMDPEHWPNVLLVDYIGVQEFDQWGWDRLSAEMYTLALGLNLYLVSENCHVHKSGSSPLRRARGLLGGRADGGQGWNGIIFANGTVIDNPPPTLHPGRMEILRNGTVLGDGTVVETSMPNPWV